MIKEGDIKTSTITGASVPNLHAILPSSKFVPVTLTDVPPSGVPLGGSTAETTSSAEHHMSRCEQSQNSHIR